MDLAIAVSGITKFNEQQFQLNLPEITWSRSVRLEKGMIGLQILRTTPTRYNFACLGVNPRLVGHSITVRLLGETTHTITIDDEGGTSEEVPDGTYTVTIN